MTQKLAPAKKNSRDISPVSPPFSISENGESPLVMANLMLKANDAEEANNFHAATQKSVRTSGFRIPGGHS